MSKAYVSEFENFMGQYMKDHPEEAAKKLRGWSEFWRPGARIASTAIARDDPAMHEPYGLF